MVVSIPGNPFSVCDLSIVLTSKYRLQVDRQLLMTELKHGSYHIIHSVCLTT